MKLLQDEFWKFSRKFRVCGCVQSRLDLGSCSYLKKRLRVWVTHYLNVGHSDVGKSEDKPLLHHGGGKCLLNEG